MFCLPKATAPLNNPFWVADYKDLQRIAYIYAHPEEWESFGLEGRLYFRQTADISLLKEGEGKYYKIDIPDFGGEYDGAGRVCNGRYRQPFSTRQNPTRTRQNPTRTRQKNPTRTRQTQRGHVKRA